MNNNEKKNAIKEPMQFFDDRQKAANVTRIKKLCDALIFGVPTLADKLADAYETYGLDGLRKIERYIDSYNVIQGIINGDIEIDLTDSDEDDDEIPVPFDEKEYDAEEWED